MSEGKRFANYDEFFAFYVREHSNPANRMMHACGTLLAAGVIVAAFALRHPVWAFLWIPVAYGFAWAGHFFLEGNRPATLAHPWWSFISDFRMLGLMLTGRLEPWLKKD